MVKKSIIGVMLTTFLVGTSAQAFGDDKPSAEVEKLKKQYIFTDKKKRCINTRLIRSTRAIDDKNILFTLNGSTFYLNEMERKCPRLKFEDRFTYTLRGTTQLCDVDIITVLDSFMNSFGSCGLGKFRVLEKKPKDKQDKN